MYQFVRVANADTLQLSAEDSETTRRVAGGLNYHTRQKSTLRGRKRVRNEQVLDLSALLPRRVALGSELANGENRQAGTVLRVATRQRSNCPPGVLAHS
ncbi:unnamed protein product [Phaeothamnion confervicola]